MKKNNILYACAAAALMFASCQKEGPVSDGTTPDIPQTSVSDMGVITATTVDTKVTTLDGVNVLWDKGDKIQLFTRTWNEGSSKFDASWCDYNSSLESPSATATFTMDENNTKFVDNTSGRYLAINHKGATVVTQSRDYYAQIAINKEQVAKNGGDFVSTLLYATSENSEFTFSHAVSYLKFTVDNKTTPFTKLTVSPVDDSEYIVSRIQVTFNTDDVTCEPIPLNASSKPYSQSSQTLSVTTDDAAAFAPGTYHIAINTGTYTEGLKFTFTNETSEYSIVSPANVEMTPGAVADMGTIGTLKFPTASDDLGTVYAENGVNLGVVFWVDENDSSKGKIISGAVKNTSWGNSTATKYDWAENINSDNGVANQAYVLGLEGSNADTYPAVYFCKNLGDGWRLPTINEMTYLVKTYYGIPGDPDTNTDYSKEPYSVNAATFDTELSKCNEENTSIAIYTTNDACWYWVGQMYNVATDKTNFGKIARVKVGVKYAIGGSNAKNAGYVRCVRDVVLK